MDSDYPYKTLNIGISEYHQYALTDHNHNFSNLFVHISKALNGIENIAISN